MEEGVGRDPRETGEMEWGVFNRDRRVMAEGKHQWKNTKCTISVRSYFGGVPFNHV
jgi:hypothetical protein